MFSFRKAFRDIANWVRSVDDYIVETGTSGIWTYEKYKSGKVKMWGKKAQSVAAKTTLNVSAFNFPFTFKAVPYVNVGCTASGGDLYRAHNLENETTVSSMRVTLINNYTAAKTVEADILVIGWIGTLGGVTNLLKVLCGRRWSYA